MKTVMVILCVLCGVTMLSAADPEGFKVWKGDAVRKMSAELEGKIDEQKFSFEQLGTYDNHNIGISHREGDGMAEVHETQVDVLIVDSGEATLTVGGTVVAPKTVKPHEVRGTSIEGGSTSQLGPGDIVHIPAKVPHQLKIAAGTKFTYTVIKVDVN